MYISATDPRGVQTTVAASTGTRIDELQRAWTLSGATTTDSLLYACVASGDGAGRLASVTYRRKVGSGSWSSVTQASYAYYGASDAHGNANDLKSATRQLPDGSGGWNTVAVTYYRYYLGGEATGFAHALKLHIGPESCRTLFNAAVDLDTASDATLLPYADHYFEYDPTTRAVTKEVAAVCESCTGGGTTSDTFTYTPNTRTPADGYNVWSVKTVQTLPDSSKVRRHRP